jgi:hypothetical protein
MTGRKPACHAGVFLGPFYSRGRFYDCEPTTDTKRLNLPKTMPTTNFSRMWYTVLALSGTMSMSMTL